MKQRILIIDDESGVRDTIRMQLESGGFEVVEADNGEKGIEQINAADNPLVVDCIISDVRMPKINGQEAITYFRKEFPSIPIIVLTGFPDVNLATDFMKQGVADYLVKPVEKAKLLEAVKKAAAQHKLFGDSSGMTMA